MYTGSWSVLFKQEKKSRKSWVNTLWDRITSCLLKNLTRKIKSIVKQRFDARLSNLVPRVLSLPWESTLVAAGHVSARFFADSRDVIKGRGWKVYVCLSTELAFWAQQGVEFVTLPLWIGKNHSEGIDTFNIGVQCVQCSAKRLALRCPFSWL